MQKILRSEPHRASSEIGYLSIADIHNSYHQGSLTPAELFDQLRTRIEEIEDEENIDLHAVIEIDHGIIDSPIEHLDISEKPLFGIPVIFKDNIEVRGWLAAAGSNGFMRPAATDAVVVERLRASGAVPLASANMTEWAAASSQGLEDGESTRGGLTGNPWALDRSAGTSSSGCAAAVAAGYAPIAIGTETMGSLSMPASHCGVFAMKATRGLVPNTGIVPYSTTQDVPGVFARNLSDLKTVMSVLVEREIQPNNNVSVCAGHDRDLGKVDQSDEELLQKYERFCVELAEIGCANADIPEIEEAEYGRIANILTAELVRDLGGYLGRRDGARWQSLHEIVEASQVLVLGVDGGVEPAPCDQFALALCAEPIDIELERFRSEKYFEDFLEEILGVNNVLLAIAYGPAEKLDTSRRYKRPAYRYHSFLDSMSSIVGWPSLTIPFTTIDDLPVGLVLIARKGCEDDLLGAAQLLESNGLAGNFERPKWCSPRRG